MRLLDTISLDCAGSSRKIDLFTGDLASAPNAFEADMLIVSAFQDDYAPSRSSLIGALYRTKGLSIQSLADDKELDLRAQFSCWLSKPIADFPFKKVLCIESGWKGTPPEIVDDLFLALAPILYSDSTINCIAMPIVGAGDQGFEADQMLKLIVAAAISWMKRGLPLKHLKVVSHKDQDVAKVKSVFSQEKYPHNLKKSDNVNDVFVSYSHKDADAANFVVNTLLEANRSLKIFIDHSDLRHGGSWPLQLANALDTSRRVIALYSQNYWDSNNCKMELLAAITRQNQTNTDILFPMYITNANIPYLFQSIHYADCRIEDRDKLRQACARFMSGFS